MENLEAEKLKILLAYTLEHPKLIPTSSAQDLRRTTDGRRAAPPAHAANERFYEDLQLNILGM